MSDIKLEIQGIEILQKLLKQFPREIRDTLSAAGRAAAELIISSNGLSKYPPVDAANRPGRTKTVVFPSTGRTAVFRVGYYIRGRGFQLPTRGGGYRNLANSETYRDAFYVKRVGYGTEIGNNASYAKWLGSEIQARHMAKRGWRKILDVAMEKIEPITDIYQRFVDRLIASLTKNG
jgi:hypothetical protein